MFSKKPAGQPGAGESSRASPGGQQIQRDREHVSSLMFRLPTQSCLHLRCQFKGQRHALLWHGRRDTSTDFKLSFTSLHPLVRVKMWNVASDCPCTNI